MANRQYIGARYVPKLCGDWDNQRTYEALSIVQYNFGSYTSKKVVPAGVAPTNPEYWVMTGNYNAQLEELSLKVAKINTYVTPEQYGAIGDGVADDSSAMQQAIDEAVRSGILLTSSGGKSYKVTRKLNIVGYITLNLNHSKIICDTSGIGSVLSIDDNGYGGSVYSNITIDTQFSDAWAISVERSSHIAIENLNIVNCNYGVDVKLGYEIFAQNWWIFNGDGKQGVTAIRIGSYDSSYNHVYAVNYMTCFECTGGNNRINDSHCWNTSLTTYGGNSVFADVKNNYNIFSRCTIDTYDIGFRLNDAHYLYIYDLLCYYDNTGNTKIFKGNTFRTFIDGVQGDGRNELHNKFADPKYSGRISGYHMVNLDTPDNNFSLNCTFESAYSVEVNNVSTTDNLVNVYFHIHGEFTNESVAVGKLPLGFEPVSYMTTIGAFGDGWNPGGTCAIAFSENGTITAYPSAAGYKHLTCSCTFLRTV